LYCCSNCFSDAFLESVIVQNSKKTGNCDFCDAKNIILIHAEELNDYFQPLFDLYEVTKNGGKSISTLLKNDWKLFIYIDENKTVKLLESIFNLELNQLFTTKKNNDETKILNWQGFKKELKHFNRYFPQKAPSYEHLNGLLQFITLPTKEVPTYLFRARVNIDTSKIDIKNMGKPPEKKSTAGRANPIGIPYLYTASNSQTAIAEIRPDKGDTITVAKFEVNDTLSLADLRNPRQSISPFALDENGLNQIFADLDYLCHLGDELSKPILPREANLEYLSSQYLCELIKHCGFDGVVYKSSVGDGDNYAIFSDTKLKAIESEVYTVEDVKISSSKIN